MCGKYPESLRSYPLNFDLKYLEENRTMLSFVKIFYSITDKHPKQEALDVLHIRPRSRLREDFLRLIPMYPATESGEAKRGRFVIDNYFL